MDVQALFNRVGELVQKYPNLSKEETHELMELCNSMTHVCGNALYDWDK